MAFVMRAGAAGIVLAALAAGFPAAAHDNKPHAPGVEANDEADARVTLHDVEMLDSAGQPVRFVADVLQDRVVVIDFFYTTCGTLCPLSGSLLAGARDELGDAVGKSVHFVSITTDPNTDTPERIAAYEAIYGASPGWTVLTGVKENVDRVLEGLGGYTTNPEDHPSMTLVGNVATGKWQRLFGLPEPERIVETVRTFTDVTTGALAPAQTPKPAE